jgi:NADH-quinone oxidoreductase subunit L
MQLFFGWEAVGLVSYLLIGFWYTRPTAIAASLKAFLVNRVGDFGFVLGIAGVLYYTGSLHYADVFVQPRSSRRMNVPLGEATGVPAMTLICICLFIGAMGKSAQVPLHVWLPDSMEGPDAHLALDPCRDHGDRRHLHGRADVAAVRAIRHRARSFVIVHRRDDGVLHGLALGIVSNDIKRVIAYSTLSQLGT